MVVCERRSARNSRRGGVYGRAATATATRRRQPSDARSGRRQAPKTGSAKRQGKRLRHDQAFGHNTQVDKSQTFGIRKPPLLAVQGRPFGVVEIFYFRKGLIFDLEDQIVAYSFELNGFAVD